MALMHLGKVKTIWTPIGHIPKHRDLSKLFSEITDKKYSQATYTKQFSLYIDNLIKRIDLSTAEFATEQDIPNEFFHTLDSWRRDLIALKSAVGPVVTPDQIIDYVAAIRKRQ